MFGKFLQRQRLLLDRQWMTALRQYDAIPAVARQQVQLGKCLVRFGGYGEVDTVIGDQRRDLLGRALVQLQVHVRVALVELPQDVRQYVAGLRVRGGDREGAFLFRGQFLAEAADVFDVSQDFARVLDDG